MQQIKQQYRQMALSELRNHPENPRRGDVEAIAHSVEVNGFYGALVVQASTGYVLAGNHRLEVLREQGAKKAPVLLLDVDDEQARKILTNDNAASDRATWDEAQLAELLSGLDDLDGSGFTDEDLD